MRYGAKLLRKPYCSCSALRFVAKVWPNTIRSNLSCGNCETTETPQGAQRLRRLGSEPAESAVILRNIGLLTLPKLKPKKWTEPRPRGCAQSESAHIILNYADVFSLLSA